jgi:hypothetical protein
MHASEAAQYGMVTYRHMPGQLRAIGEYGVIAHLTIMRDMNICHDPVVIAETRDADILHRTNIKGTTFANGVVISYFQSGRFVSIFFVLRNFAQRTKLKDAIVLADAGMAVYYTVPAPISTYSPMIEYAPTSTSAASLALG